MEGGEHDRGGIAHQGLERSIDRQKKVLRNLARGYLNNTLTVRSHARLSSTRMQGDSASSSSVDTTRKETL